MDELVKINAEAAVSSIMDENCRGSASICSIRSRTSRAASFCWEVAFLIGREAWLVSWQVALLTQKILIVLSYFKIYNIKFLIKSRMSIVPCGRRIVVWEKKVCYIKKLCLF